VLEDIFAHKDEKREYISDGSQNDESEVDKIK
jgi:hypothetical protein